MSFDRLYIEAHLNKFSKSNKFNLISKVVNLQFQLPRQFLYELTQSYLLHLLLMEQKHLLLDIYLISFDVVLGF